VSVLHWLITIVSDYCSHHQSHTHSMVLFKVGYQIDGLMKCCNVMVDWLYSVVCLIVCVFVAVDWLSLEFAQSYV